MSVLHSCEKKSLTESTVFCRNFNDSALVSMLLSELDAFRSSFCWHEPRRLYGNFICVSIMFELRRAVKRSLLSDNWPFFTGKFAINIFDADGCMFSLLAFVNWYWLTVSLLPVLATESMLLILLLIAFAKLARFSMNKSKLSLFFGVLIIIIIWIFYQEIDLISVLSYEGKKCISSEKSRIYYNFNRH